MAAVLALLAAPGALAAGAYSWAQPTNFTATAPGANPDRDPYGATPWSYQEASGASYVRLPGFGTSAGGLTGWADAADGAFIAVNPTGAPITSGSDTFQTGQLAMRPSSNQPVALGWTSPFPKTTTVTVNGTVAVADGGFCLGNFNWSLLDASGSALQSSSAGGTISSSVAVPAGGTIRLSIAAATLLYPDCATAEVTLGVQAPATTPAVTLTSPAQGSLFSGKQPTFAGSATSTFGASKQVTVRIYSGTGTSGTLLQTLHATASGGNYSVAPNPSLSDGVYTAQAEQDDLASPTDAAFSAPVSFRISNVTPSLVLNSPSKGPLTTATPTLTGTASAGTAGNTLTVLVYPGAGTSSSPARVLTGTVASDGDFSVPVTPGLDDGLYTAVATEKVAGNVALSPPVTMLIKVHGPALSMLAPAPGGDASQQPLFYGFAGSNAGDVATVKVTLFAGPTTHGRTLGTITVTRSGGTWIKAWPKSLKLGLYTAYARQADTAGHTTTTTATTFLVVPAPSVIGSLVTVSQNGTASVPIYCPARYGDVCTGTVAVVTTRRLRPAGGGPPQRLTLMRAPVTIPATRTLVIRAYLSGRVHRTLLRVGSTPVRVTATLAVSGATGATYQARRRASVAR